MPLVIKLHSKINRNWKLDLEWAIVDTRKGVGDFLRLCQLNSNLGVPCSFLLVV
jgi:hypothetical protein